jgi:hypothetical protein
MGTVRQPHIDSPGIELSIMTGTSRLSSAYWDDDEVGMEIIHNYVLHVSRGLIEWEGVSRELIEWKGDTKKVTSLPRYYRVQFIHESVREYLLDRGFASAEYVSQQDFQAKSHARMAKDCQMYLQLCLHGQHSMRRCPFKPGRTVEPLELISRRYPLCGYVWHNLLAHVESAYTRGITNHAPHDRVDRVFIHDYIILDNILYLHGVEFDPKDIFLKLASDRGIRGARVVPDHPSAFLILLIRRECYTLAEIILQNTFSSTLSDRDGTSESRASGTSKDSTELGLTTLSGGPWGSPLHAAIVSQKQDLVQLLLDRGADVNLAGDVILGGKTQRYINPLLLALQLKSSAIVNILLDHVPSLESYRLKHNFSAFHTACMFWNSETVALLLRRGVDANEVYLGNTALHIVSDNASTWAKLAAHEARKISALLNAGADVNAIDKEGQTALVIASKRRQTSIVEVLLDHGADIGFRSSGHGTALDVARRFRDFEMVNLLLSKGATGEPLKLPNLLRERLDRWWEEIRPREPVRSVLLWLRSGLFKPMFEQH